MRTRWNRHILIVMALSIFAVASVVGGVYATWDYSTDAISTHQTHLPCQLYLWNEIPAGDEGVVIEHTGTQVADSLNNPNSELSHSIESKSFFGMNAISSVDNLHGDQLRQEMGLDPDANFLVEFPDDYTRIVYTTTVNIGGTSSYYETTFDIPVGEWIYPVYRTEVHYDQSTSQWVQDATYRGYARSDEYVTFITTAPFFDPSSWTRGQLGTSLSSAIYAYRGQAVSAVLDNDTNTLFYKIVADSTNEYTISVTSPANAAIQVLDATGSPLNIATNNTHEVRFQSGAQGTVYYLLVGGAQNIEFNIA